MRGVPIRLGRRSYAMRAPFDTVLFVFDALRRKDLTERDRIILGVRLLFRHPPWGLRRKTALLQAAFTHLAGDAKPEDDGPPVMDFRQDMPLIQAAFLQQYSINLEAQRGRMSWARFVTLLAGLTDATLFIRVVQLRARPMPAPTKHNAEERRALAEAKARNAIREDDDAAMRRLTRQMQGLADGLKAKAGDPRGRS